MAGVFGATIDSVVEIVRRLRIRKRSIVHGDRAECGENAQPGFARSERFGGEQFVGEFVDVAGRRQSVHANGRRLSPKRIQHQHQFEFQFGRPSATGYRYHCRRAE